ncbi:MAG: hypothetical protein INQ03_10705 [Candidatus Heimdallarchaeota archaeon]|nr:hypothetical protein [Candidatus Heimdallarchaeota archaeon]
MNTVIQSLTFSEIIDNSSCRLENLWEYTHQKPKINSVKDKLLANARVAESALVYSPYALDSSLDDILRKQVKDNILITDLALKKIYEKNTPKHFFIRFRKSIDFSFIVFNHITNPVGYYLPKKIADDFHGITLSREQAIDFSKLFITEFWKETESGEIYFGNSRSTKIEAFNQKEILELMADFNFNSITKFNLEYFERMNIEKFTLPSNFLQKFEDSLFLDNLDELLLEYSKSIFDYIDENFSNHSQIKFADQIIGLASGNEQNFVFTEQYIISLNEKQYSQLYQNISVEWSFRDSLLLRDIKSKVCFHENIATGLSNRTFEIMKKIDIDLNPILIPDMLEFSEIYLNELAGIDPIKPQFPRVDNALEVEFKWKITPPYLPENSKKHSLYVDWPESVKNAKKRIDNFSPIINKLFRVEELPEIAKSKPIKGDWSKIKKQSIAFMKSNQKVSELFIKLLSEIQSDIHTIDINQKEKISMIFLQYNSELKEYLASLHYFIDLVKENKDSYVEEQDEISILDKKKSQVSQTVKKMVKEIETLKNINFRDYELMVESLPNFLPPRIGTLYISKNMLYLCVNFHEEIQEAYEVRTSYENAKIVINGD